MERAPSSPHFLPTLSYESLLGPVLVVLIAAVISTIGFFLAPLLFPLATMTPLGRPLVLVHSTARESGYVSADPALEALTGVQGMAAGDLRPSGIAQFDGRRVDVVSEGAFIPRGSRVEVVRVEGRRIVVRTV